MGVINKGGCNPPPPKAASAFKEPKETQTNVKAVSYLSYPFTAVIECVILPVKPRHFSGKDNFVKFCGAKMGTTNRCGAGW